MKNKHVKQMICDVLEFKNNTEVYGVYGYHWGQFWSSPQYEIITSYGLHFDGYEVKQGVISLTVKQLKGY
jgi:hypothetical protein